MDVRICNMSVMVLEDVLERLSSVPQDVRRGLELIRSLDASWMSKVRALSKEQAAALEAARRAAAGLPRDGSVDIKAALDNAAALERIETLRSEATALADEKVLLASNLMTLIDAHLRRVKADVSTFESALRASGHLQPGDLVDMMGDAMALDDVDGMSTSSNARSFLARMQQRALYMSARTGSEPHVTWLAFMPTSCSAWCHTPGNEAYVCNSCARLATAYLLVATRCATPGCPCL